MHVAQMSGTEFIAERSSPLIVSSGCIVNTSRFQTISEAKKEEPQQEWIRIPRRPKWTTSTAAHQLQNEEHDFFLEWRREIARIEDSNHFILTPFERNLEVWRQLWRVVEACHVIIQIVDARNPLLFYCEDLKTYISEIDTSKRMILLVNKADFLSEEQRKLWASYFQSIDLPFVFYSAADAFEELEVEGEGEGQTEEESIECNDNTTMAHDIYDRKKLLSYLKTQSCDKKVGMVGYPNVGKSSTINSLAGVKRVAVAATPGKTKHFQTIHLDNGVVLYDCPGLVMPNFAVSRAELILHGILPIDQLREWLSPTTLLIQLMPRDIIEGIYGIALPRPSIEEAADRLPTASELLSTFAAARGFRTSSYGNPDESRGARIILKDAVNGKLPFCIPPPSTLDHGTFNKATWDRLRATSLKKLSNAPGIVYDCGEDKNLQADRANCGVRLIGVSGTAHFAKPAGKSSKKHFNKDNRKRL